MSAAYPAAFRRYFHLLVNDILPHVSWAQLRILLYLLDRWLVDEDGLPSTDLHHLYRAVNVGHDWGGRMLRELAEKNLILKIPVEGRYRYSINTNWTPPLSTDQETS